MLIRKIYNKKKKEQKAWYDSSMFCFTKMVEDEYENKGNLTVVFNNGATYLYKDVKFEDYMLLVAGGTDFSNGKTLNKNIKPNYEYEKLDDSNVEEIKNELNELLKKEKEENENKYNTYFISGHRDITQDEFEINYIPALDRVAEIPEVKFVVGDCCGVDIMAQNYLVDEFGINPDRITVYHINEFPRNINLKITNIIGGFENDIKKDEAMTSSSNFDIAFVRDENELSGTAQNILRRLKLTKL